MHVAVSDPAAAIRDFKLAGQMVLAHARGDAPHFQMLSNEGWRMMMNIQPAADAVLISFKKRFEQQAADIFCVMTRPIGRVEGMQRLAAKLDHHLLRDLHVQYFFQSWP